MLSDTDSDRVSGRASGRGPGPRKRPPTPGSEPPLQLRLGYVLGGFPRLSQTFVRNEIRALERLGHQVRVFSLEAPKAADTALAAEASDRPVHYLEPIPSLRSLHALLWMLPRHPLRLVQTVALVAASGDADLRIALRRALVLAPLIAAAQPDHLHSHLYRGSNTLWLLNRLTGVSYSLTGHARDIYLKTRYLSRKLAAADLIVTVCDANRTRLARHLADGDRRIRVIHPFLDRSLFDAARLTGAPIRNDGPLRILCVCRLAPKKGVDVLLRALSLLRGNGLSMSAIVIGEGPERDRLAALREQLRLTDSVAMPGARAPTDVRAAMQASDCFVLPARIAANGDSDATPTVLGEAMALGLPVISSRIGGIPEVVPTDAGLLVRPGDPEALAAAIAAVAAMPVDERRAMGAGGRSFVEQHWHPDHDAKRLAALFRELIARQTGTTDCEC
jgi:glycosyltransferase involved in cell wall biosynthesis